MPNKFLFLKMIKSVQLRYVIIFLGLVTLTATAKAQTYSAAPDFYVVNEDFVEAFFDVMANDVNTTGERHCYC
jgi:hypothetical protein